MVQSTAGIGAPWQAEPRKNTSRERSVAVDQIVARQSMSKRQRSEGVRTRAPTVIFRAGIFRRVVAAILDADHYRHFPAVDGRSQRQFLTDEIIVSLKVRVDRKRQRGAGTGD